MALKGTHKISKWGLKGHGLRKHAISGVSHNHANSIAHTREHNREMEIQAEIKKKQKGKLFPTVKEAFEN